MERPAVPAADSPGVHPLLVLAGPTASGKSALALHLAERLNGEILSCDSVAVYRGMDIGSAKPSSADRDRIPHHGLDLYDPGQNATAGDYARLARAALDQIRSQGRLPIVAGGTGLYLRALLEGLAPAPPRDEALRERLRARAARQGAHHGPASLHRLLRRFDPAAAVAIHPNDLPKLVRALEVSLLGRRPQTEQWRAGRDPLRGFRTVTFLLDPPRPALHQRINARAARMFDPAPAGGLLEEAAALRARFGDAPRAFASLGYAQAMQLLRGEISHADAVETAQTGHRQYAKRQLTWFRNQLAGEVHRVRGVGEDPAIQQAVLQQAGNFLAENS